MRLKSKDCTTANKEQVAGILHTMSSRSPKTLIKSHLLILQPKPVSLFHVKRSEKACIFQNLSDSV